MKSVTIQVELNVDWELLQRQKNEGLLSVMQMIEKDDPRHDLLDGLLNLLDNIQDQAAEELGEKLVFGFIDDERIRSSF